MKVLYAYRYGIVGGVSTQLFLRQQALFKEGHQCDLFFSQDNGLRGLTGSTPGVFFGCDLRYDTVLKRGDYDHVVVIDTPELLRASRVRCWQKPRRVWLDVHTTTANGLAYLDQLDVRQLAGVMVPTRYSATLISKRLAGATPQILPNVLNWELFQPLVSADTTARWDVRQYVWVGKLDSHKNWRLALIYARMLKDLLGPIQLSMVGGYTAPAVTGQAFFELADRLDLLDSVRWLDRVDNRSLAEIYSRCAQSGGAMLVTSQDESFGMAAAEALLCGCPLIANDLPVFHEVFPSSPLVHLVDIWNPDIVAQAAKEVDTLRYTDEVVRRLYAQLRDRYGPDAFTTAFLGVLEQQGFA